MSADHDHGYDNSAVAFSYYVPDPPKIPDPPGSTVTTAPEPEPGYDGPRYLTLVRGDDWNNPQVATPVLIPYTFATRAMSNYAISGSAAGANGFELTSGEPIDAVQWASIREALALWEQVSGITFIEVPDTSQWDFAGIRFMMEATDYIIEDGGVFDVYGYAFLPQTDLYGFNVVLNAKHYGNDPLLRGSQGFWTTLHEIGHALGLKHPFDESGLVLKASEDNTRNTVMSYTDKGNYSYIGPYDTAAVQYLYGTPEAEAAAPIRWGRAADGSLVTSGDATGNAITGLSIRDVVYGHAGDDVIRTLAGDDYVLAGAGHDAVYGGAGVDTLDTGWLRRQATVAVGSGSGGSLQGTVALPDGTDTHYDVEFLRFADGDVVLSPGGTAGQAYRLYTAALGRKPDPIGLSHWAGALQSGATALSNVAADFAGSAEFAARFGAPDDAGFVTLLYQNVLGRSPDAAGLDFWVRSVQHAGIGRAGVLLGFSESAENQTKTAGAFASGLWVPNADTVDVLRAYVGVLDRLPDDEGLVNWTAAREAGMSQPELIAGFVSSAEFQARFGGLSNRDFAEQLYRTSLDRAAGADEAAYWAWVLDAGIDSRAGVALAFASSAEMAVQLTPMVADGVLFV